MIETTDQREIIEGMGTELKCICDSCYQPISFDSDHAGDSTTCPHCGGETILRPTAPTLPPVKNFPSIPSRAKDSATEFNGVRLMVVVIVIALGCLLLGYGIRDTEMGGIFMAFAGLVGLFILVLWAVLPLVVFQRLKEIADLLRRIDRENRKS